MKPLNIIIAEDQPILCDALAKIIQAIPCVKKVVQVHNGCEVLELLEKDTYDMLFLDIEMPMMSGDEALKQIKRKGYPIKVVTISMYSDAGNFMKMHRLGISGYILKNTNAEEMTRTIRVIMEGGEYYSHEVAQVLLNPSVAQQLGNTFNNTANGITEKEKEVLLLICEQLSNSDIAEKLSLKMRTVERHKESLMAKTGAVNQVGLALYAIKHGVFVL